jgi:hypothetical protein
MDETTYRVVADHAWRIADAIRTMDLQELRQGASAHGTIQECRLITALIALVPCLPDESGPVRYQREVTVELIARSVGSWRDDLAHTLSLIPDDSMACHELRHVIGGMSQCLAAVERLSKSETST